MEFGWINVLNIIMVILLLLPNLGYALKRGDERNLCESRAMNLLEQLGRYGSMLFMAVCFQKGGFGFPSVSGFVIYGFGCPILLIAYWIAWIVYFRMTGVHVFAKSQGPVAVFAAGKGCVGSAKAVKWALALLPPVLFLLCGITLRYAFLVVSALIFLVGHGYVTGENIRKSQVSNAKER